MVSKVEKDIAQIRAEQAPATEQVRKTAHRAVDQAAEKAGAVEEKVRTEADRLKEIADNQREATRQKIDAGLRRTDRFIQERPLAAAGIAFAAGAVAAMLLRRS